MAAPLPHLVPDTNATDCDRAKVEPLMDKALTPYVKGGGARKYAEELKKIATDEPMTHGLC